MEDINQAYDSFIVWTGDKINSINFFKKQKYDSIGVNIVRFELVLIVLMVSMIPLLFLSLYNLVGAIISLVVLIIGFLGALNRRRVIFSFYAIFMIMLSIYLIVGIIFSLISLIKMENSTPSDLNDGDDTVDSAINDNYLFYPGNTLWNIFGIVISFVWLIINVYSIMVSFQVKKLLDYFHFAHNPTIYTPIMQKPPPMQEYNYFQQQQFRQQQIYNQSLNNDNKSQPINTPFHYKQYQVNYPTLYQSI